MLSNYLKIALRNFTRNSVFSLINVLGLSLGMAAFIFILQYISFEKNVNMFHSNLPDLHRVLTETREGDYWLNTPPTLAPQSKPEFAEIKNYCRIAEGVATGIVTNESASPISFKEERIVYADSSFFSMFSFHIVQGSHQAIQAPNVVAISESMAKKYFGQPLVIGKTLILDNQFGKTIYVVGIVYADFPSSSDLHYDMIFSLQTLANPANLNDNSWASLDGSSSFLTTYLLIQPQVSVSQLESKLNKFKIKAQPNDENILRLQPLENMHLAASLDDPYPSYGNLGFVYLLTGIAMLIVIIAWLNYINLSTASALKRAKEVALRKVTGAGKKQLIMQFLSESLILNVTALLVAFVFVNVLQVVFNTVLNKPLSLSILFESSFWITGLLFLAVGTFSSGFYTSFVLSSFNPAQTLKGAFSKSFKGAALRKTLVVFQFSISVLLMASTLILYRQLKFMQTKDLGMNLNQLLVITGPEVGRDATYKQRANSFKNELEQASFIEKYSSTGSVPTQGYNFSTAGITRLNAMPGDEKISYSIAEIDDRFTDAYGISLAAGNNFSPEDCAKKWNDVDKIMVNEQAAVQLGFESGEQAIGQKIKWEDRELEIKGVIKDYHHMSVQQSILPIVYMPRNNSHFFTVKIQTDKIQDHIAYLNTIYKQYFPGNPFEYFFVNENYNRQYASERQYGYIFTAASCLAIFIACLGLFGLSTFTVEQRTKEIGIRKVLGANVSQVTALLSKDFMKLVGIAIVIATPFSWWLMNTWLQGFAYRITLNGWMFLISAAIATGIALFTVSFQSIKAALTNPVSSLRNE